MEVTWRIPNSAPIGFFSFFFLKRREPEARAAARRSSEYWMLPPPLPLSLSLFQSLPHSQGINSRKLIILPRALWERERAGERGRRKRERERDGLHKDSEAAAVCIITPSVLWAWLDVIHCCFTCLGMSNHCCHGDCCGAPVRHSLYHFQGREISLGLPVWKSNSRGF